MNEYNKALEIVRKLQENRFESYFIGGAVRDKLLGLKPKDYDVVTNAKPEEISKLFKDRKLSFVGEQFKVMIVDGIEVATYRGERYDKAGKPTCTYVKTLKQDCSRRDFTMNAIAYNPMTDEYKDYFGGVVDIKSKTIRFIGEAEDRLTEDPIRALRALRFATLYDMDIVYSDYKQMQDFDYEEYAKIPKERIKIEIDKVLKSDNFLKFFSSFRSVADNFFPYGLCEANTEFAKPESFTNSSQKLAALLLNNGGYEEDLRDLKYSNEEIKIVTDYIETSKYLVCSLTIPEQVVDLYGRKLSINDWYDFNRIVRIRGELQQVKDLAFFLYTSKSKIQALSLKDLAINGDDVMKVTDKKGRDIGKILDSVFELVIHDSLKNDREVLLTYTGEHYGE